jgi:hypothetical protein
MAIVDKTNFGNGGKLAAMKAQVETMYADVFCGGEHEEALGKLRLAKTQIDPRILLGVMFKVGIVVMLLIWLLNKLVVAPRLSLLYLTTADPCVYVYAAAGALVTYRWFWGFSVYMWDSADIDYILILDLDANKHMPSAAQIFSDAANWSILYLVNVLIFHSLRYNYRHDTDQPATWSTVPGIIAYFSARAYVMPALLVLGTVIRMLMEISQPASYGVFSYKIIKKVRFFATLPSLYHVTVISFLDKQLLMSPFTAVHLRHTYAADILCSFVKVFSAMLFGACYFTSGSYLYASDPASAVGDARFLTCSSSGMLLAKVLIYVFPYYIRLMQCLRQRRDYFVRQRQEKTVHAGGAQDDHSTASETHTNQDGDSARGDGTSSGVAVGRSTQMRSRKLSVTGVPRATDAATGKPDVEAGYTSSEVQPFSDLLDAGDAIELERLNARHELALSPRHYDQEYDGRDSPSVEMTTVNKPVAARTPQDSGQPLSRSESFDLPTPSILRMLCGGSTNIVPAFVVQFLKTVWVWPYSYNALRYFLNICVIVFGAYPPQNPLTTAYMAWYIPLYVISTLYSCYWDVANDFQLLQFHSSRPLLRDKILYEDAEYFYYIVLVINPLLRFMWTLSFTPYGGHPFLVVFEIMRRSLWACIRMEVGYIQELARRK